MARPVRAVLRERHDRRSMSQWQLSIDGFLLQLIFQTRWSIHPCEFRGTIHSDQQQISAFLARPDDVTGAIPPHLHNLRITPDLTLLQTASNRTISIHGLCIPVHVATLSFSSTQPQLPLLNRLKPAKSRHQDPCTRKTLPQSSLKQKSP